MPRTLHALLVALLVLVAVPGAAAGMFAPVSAPAANNTTSTATGNDTVDRDAAFGVRLTGFMAESAADANTSVEQEFWEQGFERSRNHTRAAMGRTNSLQKRYATLQERQRELLAARANGTGPGNAVDARLRAVNATLDALADAINRTTETTRRHNATPPELDDLRDAVRNHSRGHDFDGDRERGGTGRPPWAGTDEEDGENAPNDATNRTRPGNDGDATRGETGGLGRNVTESGTPPWAESDDGDERDGASNETARGDGNDGTADGTGGDENGDAGGSTGGRGR